ncbi:hypothetical protein LSH36_189g04033 [Paralvinella palmiformis]|uniref:Uncharacterized protein n=1 Tax=Paralvinella palmiformis TaxID=53620 RepID=A0AAD9N775_9ANNE|nr:hypothetical protein LSH36_189g04033 [Paralvinella palmiformis]
MRRSAQCSAQSTTSRLSVIQRIALGPIHSVGVRLSFKESKTPQNHSMTRLYLQMRSRNCGMSGSRSPVCDVRGQQLWDGFQREHPTKGFGPPDRLASLGRCREIHERFRKQQQQRFPFQNIANDRRQPVSNSILAGYFRMEDVLVDSLLKKYCRNCGKRKCFGGFCKAIHIDSDSRELHYQHSNVNKGKKPHRIEEESDDSVYSIQHISSTKAQFMVSVIYHDNDASKWISIESQLDTGASCSAMSIADPRRTVHVFIIVDYENDTLFMWGNAQAKSFNIIKRSIARSQVLGYYDMNEEQSGLGATLLQAGKQSERTTYGSPVTGHPAQDLFSLHGDNYLVTVDYYGDYFELDRIPDMTAPTEVECTKAHFMRHTVNRMARRKVL